MPPAVGVTDPARHGALSLLLRHEAGDGYANLLADSDRLAAMEPRERALMTALFYGTVERRLTLDYAIGVLAGRSAASLTPHTRAALRLGLYQLMYMDVPTHAAVDTTVRLGKGAGERGFLNGVLRAAAAHPERTAPPPAERDLVRHLSIAFSIPAPTVRYFLGRLGEEETRALLAAFNTRPPLFLRVNTQRTSREAYLALLVEGGIEAEPDPLTAYGVRIADAPPVAALPGYAEGLFFIQDAASQLASELLSPREGDTVLDLCACPGGKTFGADVSTYDDHIDGIVKHLQGVRCHEGKREPQKSLGYRACGEIFGKGSGFQNNASFLHSMRIYKKIIAYGKGKVNARDAHFKKTMAGIQKTIGTS